LNADNYINSSLGDTAKVMKKMLSSCRDDIKTVTEALEAMSAGQAIFEDDLPASVRRHANVNKIVFLQLDRYVRFQSRLMERAWVTRLRSQYMPNDSTSSRIG
jgi:hypothetical protein